MKKFNGGTIQIQSHEKSLRCYQIALNL